MKRKYFKPTTIVVELQQRCMTPASGGTPQVETITSDADVELVGDDTEYVSGGGGIR